MQKNKLYTALLSVFLSIAISSCDNLGGGSSSKVENQNLEGQSGGAQNVTTQSWNYTYNAMDLLETATDPNGGVTRYDYDGQGNVSKITNPLKQTIQFSEYTEDGNPQTIIDQNGVTTKLTYTIDGWLSSSTTDGAVTRFDYDNIGQLKKITMPDGNFLAYTYDGARRLTQVNSPTGTIKYEHDNAGNITSKKIYGDTGIVYEDERWYDELNRMWWLNIGKQRSYMYKYDNDDNVIEYNDYRSRFYSYDSLQRVTSEKSQQTTIASYEYDNTKNLNSPSSITDGRGNKTSYDYNGISNLLGLISPDSGTHKYTAYDGNGNLLEQTDARGQLISYSYDLLNRPKTISYSGDATLNTTFTYDNGSYAVGRLSKVQNGNSSNSYYYDSRGNTTGEVQRINNTDYSLTYAYDKADNLTNIVYPSGTQVVYSYTNGQISKVTVNGKTLANITHMPFGGINQIAFGNGVTEDIKYTMSYDIAGISLSNGLFNRDYVFYGTNINKISGLGSYYYNNLNMLDLFMNEDYSYMQFYDYDSVGNMYAFSEYGGSKDIGYEISPTSNRLISQSDLDEDDEPISTMSYSYDNAGNMTKAGTMNYVYDGLNRLKEATIDDLKNGKSLASYQYNSFSQRIVKDVNGNKTIFIYNSAGQLLEEINKAQNTTRDYIYVDGVLIGATENGILVYIVTDHLNAPQLMMDGNGRQIWSATYTPLGKATTTGNIKLNLRADGQYQDDETGLYYNWYRYYNPDLGRYITSDPIGLAAGMNTYIYVNGNPINYTDPMGLNPAIIAGAEVGSMILPGYGTIAGAVIGGVGGYVIGEQISNIINNRKPPADAYDRNGSKAPGYPGGQHTDFCPGKNGDNWVKTPKGWGFEDKWGRVWVPTGPEDHGGPHWDVQPKPGAKKGKGSEGGNAMPPRHEDFNDKGEVVNPSDRWRSRY